MPVDPEEAKVWDQQRANTGEQPPRRRHAGSSPFPPDDVAIGDASDLDAVLGVVPISAGTGARRSFFVVDDGTGREIAAPRGGGPIIVPILLPVLEALEEIPRARVPAAVDPGPGGLLFPHPLPLFQRPCLLPHAFQLLPLRELGVRQLSDQVDLLPHDPHERLLAHLAGRGGRGFVGVGPVPPPRRRRGRGAADGGGGGVARLRGGGGVAPGPDPVEGLRRGSAAVGKRVAGLGNIDGCRARVMGVRTPHRSPVRPGGHSLVHFDRFANWSFGRGVDQMIMSLERIICVDTFGAVTSQA